MKVKKIKYLFFFLLFFFSSYKFTNLDAAEVKILYKINDQIITNIDVKKELRYLKILNDDLNYLDEGSALQIAKKSLINEKIKSIEIKKNLVTNNDNEEYLERIINQFYLRMNLSDKGDIKNFLKKNSFSEDFIEKKLRIETQWNELIFLKYRNQIDIDRDKLRKKLDKDLSNKKKQVSYHLYEILFVPENTSEIESLYEEIKKSIDTIGFKNTANLYSISDTAKNGGEIGWIKEFQLNKKIRNKLKNLKIGQIAKPIATSNGQLILKIEDFKQIEISLDVNKELDKYIINEKNRQLNQFSKIYFKKLKENIKINEK